MWCWILCFWFWVFCSLSAEFVLIGRLVFLFLCLWWLVWCGCAHEQRCVRRRCSRRWRRCRTGPSLRCPCLQREPPLWPRAQTGNDMTLVGTCMFIGTRWCHIWRSLHTASIGSFVINLNLLDFLMFNISGMTSALAQMVPCLPLV